MNTYERVHSLFNHHRTQVMSEFSSEADFIAMASTERLKFVSMVAQMRMMKRGHVPSTFIYQANCSRCGYVPNDYACDIPVLGCVWCNNNAKPQIYTYKI